MLTDRDYCDYDTAITLSELGFPLKRMKVKNFIDGQFSDSIVTVLLYAAQKWLREEKDINVYVKAFNGEGWYYIIQNYKGARIYPPLTKIIVLCHSYEEALSEGIKKAVKYLKDGIGE